MGGGEGGVMFLFAVCAGGDVFFAVWAVSFFFFFFFCLGSWRFFFLFLLFGQGACFFCCLGGGREFTHLPVFLARLQGDPSEQKRPKQPKKKKNTRSDVSCGYVLVVDSVIAEAMSNAGQDRQRK